MAKEKKIKKSKIDNSKYASLKMQKMDLSKLKPHPRNPRKHPEKGSEQWNTLKASLECDYFDPIVWNKKNGLLVSGHLRTKVLLDAGFTHADAVVVSYDENMHFARMIAANKSIGEDDEDMLKQIFEELDSVEFNTDLTGFGEDELADILAPMDLTGGGGGDGQAEVQFTEELMEQQNYVVLYFDNEVDWLQAQTLMGIKSKKSLFSVGNDKIGVGRVIRGADAINRIQGHTS